MFWPDRRLEQEPFHGAAVQFIRRRIHFGQLQPGQQLPPERKLAETLGISRVTLREAFKVLEEREYIISRRGAKGGTFVAAANELNEIARRSLSKDPGKAWRMLEYLRANLLSAAEFACDRRGPGDISLLEILAARLQESDDGAQMREIRCSFMTTLTNSSSNAYFVDAVTLAADGLFHPIPERLTDPLRSSNVEAFWKIIDGLKQREIATVKRACEHSLEDIATAINNGVYRGGHR